MPLFQAAGKEVADFLDEKTLCQILKALRRGTFAKQDRLLLSLLAHQFQWIPRHSATSIDTVEAQVFLQLSDLIHREYNRLRRIHDLHYLELYESAAQSACSIREDFGIGSQELEAWSLLYYRYARSDLCFSLAKMRVLAGQSLRNLNRREKLGITRLSQRLLNQLFEFRWGKDQALWRIPKPRQNLSCPFE